jgi:hypothetical protein
MFDQYVQIIVKGLTKSRPDPKHVEGEENHFVKKEQVGPGRVRFGLPIMSVVEECLVPALVTMWLV